MESSSQEKNHMHGHRDRVRTKFINNGINALAEHEILEFILFHSIPRTDTKPLTYKLLDNFGSLDGVLSAPYEALTAFGLSKNSAALIKLISSIPSWLENANIAGTKVTGYNEIGNIFLNELKNDKTERVVVLFLDSKDRVISLKTICTGSFTGSEIDTSRLAHEAVLCKAAKIAMAHNHPAGTPEASLKDHMATCTVENLCSMLGIKLIEHYIIADNSFFGINRAKNDVDKAGQAIYLQNHGYHTDL